MRVDRNGSVLAILSVSLPAEVCDGRGLLALDDFLYARLRQTDTVGWRTDGRLGLLLPDTSREGAEVVADAIAEQLGEHAVDAAFEIHIYPDQSDHADSHQQAKEPVGVDSPVGAGVDAGIGDRVFFQAMPGWKRAVDIAGASLGLIVAGPFLLTAAGAVVLTSRGGAFYRQEREGLAGKRFQILKLRTMVADADRQKASLRHHSVQDGPAFKMYRDPRVTTVGRFLRATSLDELPQLINVLRGDMSLVGPRPLPVDESLACSRWQRRRLQVTPGITCTWQVTGRNTVTFDEWMRMDLRYARRRSLAQDLWLLACTGPSILLARGPR
ncbi:putative sugar transferase EpsL [Posidoniimonas polymericola]|uniref:Putative sugar transferase EpsL n=2 Tax=Posidoniimonas polymericola TaxID=2528002 RepID=A0A5C5XWC5_9BACT|nr:putative sugar transferase EpsL [Posidoniimonas polymericola]